MVGGAIADPAPTTERSVKLSVKTNKASAYRYQKGIEKMISFESVHAT